MTEVKNSKSLAKHSDLLDFSLIFLFKGNVKSKKSSPSGKAKRFFVLLTFIF
jgi:hypothetical protein